MMALTSDIFKTFAATVIISVGAVFLFGGCALLPVDVVEGYTNKAVAETQKANDLEAKLLMAAPGAMRARVYMELDKKYQDALACIVIDECDNGDRNVSLPANVVDALTRE